MKPLILAAGMLAAGIVFAETPQTARDEIIYLLASVEKSGCKFSRNGSWHDAKAARMHLEKKFAYLERKGLAPSAEMFIERAASASSISGKPYAMQCPGTGAVTSSAWLSSALQRYRGQAGK